MLNQVSKLFTVAALAVMIVPSVNAQTVKHTIALPNPFAGGIAANALTNRIYAVSPSGTNANDLVSVIDGSSDVIIANVSVPSGAFVPAVNALTNKIYIASCNFNETPTPCFVTVIDGKTNTVTASIPVSKVLGGFIAGIAVNPVSDMIYVSDNTDNAIAVIDGRTNTLTSTITLSTNPWGLAVNPFTNQLYVTLGGNEIDIINLASKQIVQASTGADSVDFNVAVDILSGHVFVSNTQAGPSTTAILSSTGAPIAQVTVPGAAYGLDVDPITGLAFVADVLGKNTDIINGRTKTFKGTIGATSATFIAVNPITEKVYGIGGNGVVTVAKE